MTHELLRERLDIVSWLERRKIANYELIEDREYGYTVNVGESVYLYSRKLKFIKVKFNIISGNFDCSDNNLISLYGAPSKVYGNFSCSYNYLRTLRNSPEIVKGSLYSWGNRLEKIEVKDLPDIEGNIYVNNNPLLGDIQKIQNVQQLKEILRIGEENQWLKSTIKSTTIDNKIIKL